MEHMQPVLRPALEHLEYRANARIFKKNGSNFLRGYLFGQEVASPKVLNLHQVLEHQQHSHNQYLEKIIHLFLYL